MSEIKIELALRLTPQMREDAQRRIAAREQRKLGMVWRPELARFERNRSEVGVVDLGDLDV